MRNSPAATAAQVRPGCKPPLRHQSVPETQTVAGHALAASRGLSAAGHPYPREAPRRGSGIMSIPLPEFFTTPGVRDIDSQEDRMARERWRQQGDNRPQAARDLFDVGWEQRRAMAQEAERLQNAQQPPPQPQGPAGDVHIHAPPEAPEDRRPPLQRMGDDLEEAFRNENDSRVAQARESNRLQHAKDIESMRQEGLLQRLQMMNDSAYQPPQGGGIGVWNPVTQQFDYTDRVRFG